MVLRSFICIFVFITGFIPLASSAAPVPVDIQSFRTPVSPGTVEEDLLILREIIPEIARRMFPPSSGYSSRSGPDTLDLRLSQTPKAVSGMNGFGRMEVLSESRLLVNGAHYLKAAEAYLQWRKAFEMNWSQSDQPSWEPKAVPKTPLQRIFEDPALDTRGKAQAMVKVYYRNPMTRNPGGTPEIKPTPTPPPEFWPVSDVIDMPEINGSVQFNLRGHKVTVLDKSTGEASVIPYYSTQDPRAWLTSFRRQALRDGLAQAVRNEQDKAKNAPLSRDLMQKAARKVPQAPPPSTPTPLPPEEKPKPQIPWGE